MKIVVSDSEGRFVFEEVPAPEPGGGAVLVRVLATSLNPRDLRMARLRAGYRCGMDFVGVVEHAAGRSGPQAGARVAGILPAGAWAELLAVPQSGLALVPDGVELPQAAALPSAGLTALYTLARGGELLGRKVLVTAAAGGVGRVACRLARLAGAQVTASVRSPQKVADLAGVVHTVVGGDPAEAKAHGPFDLILESIGGDSLAAAAKLLAPGGTCVAFGATSGAPTTLDAAELYQNSRTLTGFALFVELNAKPVADGLPRLLRLVADGRLPMPIAQVRSWREANEAAAEMASGAVTGKIVLELD